MANAKVRVLRPRSEANSPTEGVLGWIAEVAKSGRATVDYPGNRLGPLPARSVVRVSAEELATAGEKPAVLLLFENGDQRRPVIAGFVSDLLVAPRESEKTVTGERLVLNGQKEVVIRCGEGAIVITADGRLVIKGRELVSRASETNKIRGAQVSIN